MEIVSGTTAPICRQYDSIVGYIEGELSPEEEVKFEVHLTDCASCRKELNREKQMFIALEASLFNSGTPELPENFARQVSVAAVTDVSGIRQPRERYIAIVICALLGLFLLAALGGSAGAAAGGAVAIADRAVALFTVVGHFVYHIAQGVTIMLRPISDHLGQAMVLWGGVLAGVLAAVFVVLRFARRDGRSQ